MSAATTPPSFARLLRHAALPFLAGAAATTLCWLACGITLGIFFGGVAVLLILVPPLAARDGRAADALVTAGAVGDGVAVVWLIAALRQLSLLQWLQAYIVLIAVGLAALGLLLSLRRIIGAPAAAGVTTIVFLAWMSWPVWLSPWADARIVALLAPVHPLLALNRVFIDLGIWTQQPLMYQLTTLGQDVPYELPESILACTLAHVLMGLALGWPAWWWEAREAPEARAEHPARPSAASPAP